MFYEIICTNLIYESTRKVFKYLDISKKKVILKLRLLSITVNIYSISCFSKHTIEHWIVTLVGYFDF